MLSNLCNNYYSITYLPPVGLSLSLFVCDALDAPDHGRVLLYCQGLSGLFQTLCVHIPFDEQSTVSHRQGLNTHHVCLQK